MRCPRCGGASSDAEFCSECGAPMMAGSVAPAPPAAPGAAEACPVCGEARPGPTARFCDTCRYDFSTGRRFSAAASPEPLAPPAAPVAPVAPVAEPAPPAPRFDLHAEVDASLRRPDDPTPDDLRPRIFPLDHADHLVGRRDDRADVHPEVVVNDPGISRRHARVLRAADGALSVLDLGSMNGTRLNGATLEPNVPARLADGDQLTLGCWTRLTVRAR